MLPTLNGRIQTRLFVLLLVGGITQLLISPFLPGTGDAPLSEVYAVTFSILVATILVGVLWELLYHLLMQFRWEKDWPTLFGLLTVVPEGLVIWALVRQGVLPGVPATLPLSTFLVDFLVVWLVFWLWVNGPMRIFSVHWRFNGGRLV